MLRNKQKHNILKALYDFFESQEKQKFDGGGPTTLGQTLTVVEITNKTRLTADEIQRLCYTLTNAGHIELFKKDDANKSHRYLITDSGRQAYVDNFYVNQLWYRDKDFWLKFLPIIISAGTLIWTVTVNNALKKTVSEQESRIIQIQSRVDSSHEKLNHPSN